ncbi:MAG TPA: TIM barrel protein [Gaiellaceae bacterium]|nr:TIM barrel protein [Gaiellaceae bacterium]
MIRVANAPVSYGAFELTVGVLPNVPDPDDVLGAIAGAGYEGTELGPVGYLGRGAELRERLERHGLALAGAFVELRFGDGDYAPLEATLDAIDGFHARAVLCDRGPRDGDVDLDGVRAATELTRTRGFTPVFHHHMGTRVETTAEIERLLESTDVDLLLDTGHAVAGGGDPGEALRRWRDRIGHVHVKDVRLEILRRAADWDDAWQNGVFCELGTGDVDLGTFLSDLVAGGYDGWIVVEQDRFPGDLPEAARAQARNRRWLAEL